MATAIWTGGGLRAQKHADIHSSLLEKVNEVVCRVPGTVGVALVTESDTLLVNNGVRYPMMSVFKLHEALAVADRMERNGQSLDSIMEIRRVELDSKTWSPMLRDFAGESFNISVGDLIRYALISSDNNASNVLFQRIVTPLETDRYIRSIAPDTTFSIRWSEEDMRNDHDLAYENFSSPLAAGLLLRKLFNSEELLNDSDREFIRCALTEVTTGHDRIGAPVRDKEDVLFAHKTGSGYRNSRGELAAHNDIGYFRLPDGRDYTLAVMIRDFMDTDQKASDIMSEISTIVYESMR